MLTIESTVFVQGVCGQEIFDFMLACTDKDYRRWWPGTHLRFHTLKRGPGEDHVGDTVLMDEYVGKRRVRLSGVVVEAVPDKKIVWQLRKGVILPVRLSIELLDRDGGVALRHTISAGFRGFGRILDPLLRLYFSPGFAAAMDHHANTEFALLGERLIEARPGP